MTEKRRLLLSLVFLLLLAIRTYSQEEFTYVNLILRDASTNRDISNVNVFIEFDNNKAINQFIRNNGVLMRIDKGSYNVVMMVDDMMTEGRDYYGKETIIIDGNLTRIVYVYPVGTLRGIVKDKLDNLVSYAKLKFECTGPILIEYPANTDKFGSFMIEAIPESHCKIFAVLKEGIGFKDINIERGSLNDIEININTSLISDNSKKSYTTVIIVSVLGVMFAIVVRFLIPHLISSRKQKKDIKPENRNLVSDEKKSFEIKAKHHSEIVLGEMAKGILATLSDKEIETVEFIVSESGKTTQSRIYYGTGIPKVSLHRYIRLLEQKRIIEVKKVGKVNQIQLTKLFLGGEDSV